MTRESESGCPVMVWPNSSTVGLMRKGQGRPAYRCGEPPAPGSKFCAKHEADRIRLSK